MISVVGLYKDVVHDAMKSENGELSYADFNALIWRSQLRLINWLTGNFDEQLIPEQISTQKSRDWLSFLIKRHKAQVQDGFIVKPADYYLFRAMYKLKGVPLHGGECDDEEILDVRKEPIELLDNSKFNVRCATSIKRLKPSVKPIAQLTEDNKFEFAPKDMGSSILEYYRYPVKAAITTKVDNVYNDEIPDTVVDIEFPEAAREVLTWFVLDTYFLSKRDFTGKQIEQTQTGKPKQ